MAPSAHKGTQLRCEGEGTMKLHYYAETDSLDISLVDGLAVDALEVSEGLVADLDENGRVIGLDIDQASVHLDLRKVETFDLPLTGS